MTAAAPSLAGRRVLLTRSDEDCAVWAEELERYGIVGLAFPCITAEPFDSPALADALVEESAHADWIVFTSKRGVEAFDRLTRGRAARDTAAAATGPKVAVVGPATGEAAMRLVGRVDLIGEGGTAAALATTMIERLSAQAAPQILLAVAENARDTLERDLTQAGMHCKRIDVYRTVAAAPLGRRTSLAELEVDYVFLASPSAVTGFVNQIDVDGSARIVAIGSSTSEAARALGLTVSAEAAEPSLEGLVAAMQ